VRFKYYLLGLSVLILYFIAYAAIPTTINYQGRLTDSTGNVVPDGNYSVTFVICDDSTAGDTLWAEGTIVTVKDGLFSIQLGRIVPIADSIFGGENRWLGMQIGLEPEIHPRVRLGKVPYAAHTYLSDVAVTSLDKTINASELTQGTLDTQRYSAYQDLLSENRIGDQAGQVAAGDHSHTIASIRVVQDSSSIDTAIFSANGEYLVKTMVIPANTLGNFFTVYCSLSNAHIVARLRVNGQQIGSASSQPAGTMLFTTWVTRSGNIWRARNELIPGQGPYEVEFNFDRSQANTLTISVESDGSGSGEVLNVGTAWIELGPK